MACGIAIKEELENDFCEIFTHDQNEFVSIEKSSNSLQCAQLKSKTMVYMSMSPF